MSKTDLSYFCKARFVVNIIALMAYRAGLFEIPGKNRHDLASTLSTKEINIAISNLSFSESKLIYNKGVQDLLLIVHPNSQRSSSIVYTTLYKRIKNYDKASLTKLGSFISK